MEFFETIRQLFRQRGPPENHYDQNFNDKLRKWKRVREGSFPEQSQKAREIIQKYGLSPANYALMKAPIITRENISHIIFILVLDNADDFSKIILGEKIDELEMFVPEHGLSLISPEAGIFYANLGLIRVFVETHFDANEFFCQNVLLRLKQGFAGLNTLELSGQALENYARSKGFLFFDPVSGKKVIKIPI